MSMCDRCYQPGACCKGFTLSGLGTFWEDEGNEPVQAKLDSMPQFNPPHGPYPFKALGPDPVHRWVDDAGRYYAHWRFWCPQLDDAGRCSIWSTRPDTCSSFEPGSDALCVHFRGAEGGEGVTQPYPVGSRDAEGLEPYGPWE